MIKTRKPGSGRPRLPQWDDYVHELGTKPDQRIAEKMGVTVQAVGGMRRRLGISPFGKNRIRG